MKKFYFLLLCIASFAQMHAAITPESLQAAADYSAPRRGYALLVMQHGKIIFEEYQNGSTADTTHRIYSGTKTFWNAAMLAAVNDGLLTLDERVSDTIPAWRSDLLKRNITIRQVMNFTDGIEPAFKLHEDNFHDRNAYAIRVPLVAKPGTSFTYGPSHGQIMIEVLRRKLLAKNTTPFLYLQRKVLDPLGLGPVEHKEDAVGNPLIATGFQLTARQWLQFGVMILHNGTYGKKEIVPANLLDESFHGTGPNPLFGLGFWLNSEAAHPGARERDVEDILEKDWKEQDWSNTCISHSAPADMVVALGSGYQRLYVIPSLDLVIVRQGENAKFSDAIFLHTLLDH